MKDKTTAIILAALLGGLGIDRFYLGYTGMGVLKLLTGGCFGVLWILDIINIASGKLLPADGSGYLDDKNIANKQGESLKCDPYEELKTIAKLHEDGILSDEEYEQLKRKTLNKI